MPDQWSDVMGNKDCFFVNLQYGDVEQELAEFKSHFGVDIYQDDLISSLSDLEAALAQIAALDLVISIDNSTVHLAGSIGKETWALLPYVPDWRWMLGREDSLWYSSPQVILSVQELPRSSLQILFSQFLMILCEQISIS